MDEIQDLQIVFYPHPALLRKAEPVTAVDEQIRRLVERMFELLADASGVGLAATQVGVPLRLFVANVDGQADRKQVFINPELTDPSRELEDSDEGCLSLPDIRGQIRRPKGITITAQDLAGNSFTRSDDQLAARMWQHECDHLDGVLITDRMMKIDRMANQQQMRSLEQAAPAGAEAGAPAVTPAASATSVSAPPRRRPAARRR